MCDRTLLYIVVSFGETMKTSELSQVAEAQSVLQNTIQALNSSQNDLSEAKNDDGERSTLHTSRKIP